MGQLSSDRSRVSAYTVSVGKLAVGSGMHRVMHKTRIRVAHRSRPPPCPQLIRGSEATQPAENFVYGVEDAPAGGRSSVAH